ncbi:molybdopterin synthase catalytic subunit MoaE [Orrella daihaiensis]|uniref:Molybdopterin synthase catalytic subunit n=1 Tax=Orrella daihaiensis TaxID=2782176 RepID=A0ABY4ALH2_9BURK|nr:molybdopterin synthase catalytic subunit MoaE [Orrella daihaiensis]UOD51024.1 molybdopterin synthase catalytic subunit MoaE [Orrella daihaiensis]
MDSLFQAKVQTEAFDFGEEYYTFLDGDRAAGAVASFVGRVREINDDQDIKTLELEHYPGMTEKVMLEVLNEARQRWPLLGARVIHRVGPLKPGENIVLVLTASAHRHAALDSCAFIMDHLKTRATFWKKETTPQGEHWIKGRDSDELARARWDQNQSGKQS